MRVTVNPVAVIQALRRRGKVFVTVPELAAILGISRQAAGKLLAQLAREGVVERWSRRAYRIRLQAAGEAHSYE